MITTVMMILFIVFLAAIVVNTTTKTMNILDNSVVWKENNQEPYTKDNIQAAWTSAFFSYLVAVVAALAIGSLVSFESLFLNIAVAYPIVYVIWGFMDKKIDNWVLNAMQDKLLRRVEEKHEKEKQEKEKEKEKEQEDERRG